MQKFQAANNCIMIDDTPYPLNSLIVEYNGNRITVRHYYQYNVPVVNDVLYNDILNGAQPFLSMLQLKEFVIDHFFGAGGGSTVITGTVMITETGKILTTEIGLPIILE